MFGLGSMNQRPPRSLGPAPWGMHWHQSDTTGQWHLEPVPLHRPGSDARQTEEERREKAAEDYVRQRPGPWLN